MNTKKKALGVSQEAVMDAIMNPARKIPPVSNKGSGKASVQAHQPSSPVATPARRPKAPQGGDLKIANPNYSPEQIEEMATGSRLSTTARVPTMLRLMLRKPIVLKDPNDPAFSRLDEISMIKLSLFMLNGIPDEKIKECIDICDNLPTKGVTISVKINSLFVKDFVEDGVYSRVREISKSDAKRMFSYAVRLGMVMIGKLSEDGVLDDALKQAINLQYEYGLNLVG